MKGNLAILFSLLSCGASAHAVETIKLSTLDLAAIRRDWGKPQVGMSVTQKPMRIGKRTFSDGIGMHAVSEWRIALDGRGEKFSAQVGVDAAASDAKASLEFIVLANGLERWKSGVCKRGDEPRPCEVALAGVKLLTLIVTDAGDGNEFDHANWAAATISYTGAPPKSVPIPAEEAVILTPAPGPAPRINGPKVYGCRPGHPFLYRIPCTGERPMQFTAKSLPVSLKLDVRTGIITGTVPDKGQYQVAFTAMNSHGKSERGFKIVAGDKLALTPSMGFNDWYAYYNRVTDADMRHAADAMIRNGMADAGYQYVNLDDCWMGKRDAAGNLNGNKNFPDMKALADYIHGKGLKAGLYTSPGPTTCAGYEGAFNHEAQDAKRFADWGYDFLKCDWCSYGKVVPQKDNLYIVPGKSIADFQKPYRLMGDLLKEQKRDIEFNLCQYGMGDVWNWGAEVGGHSWRTGGDLGFELNRIFEIAIKNCGLRDHNRPGAWNDPDYIQIGWIGDAHSMGKSRPAPLTPNESYAFMSLWCLMASPLFYSGDMTKLDAFTLNILCNPEVIEVDQDPLGQCARIVGKPGQTFVLVKDLEDGGKAVGLCNRGEFESSVGIAWSDAGVTGERKVRDLWRQKDLGKFSEKFSTKVPRHGVVLVKIH